MPCNAMLSPAEYLRLDSEQLRCGKGFNRHVIANLVTGTWTQKRTDPRDNEHICLAKNMKRWRACNSYRGKLGHGSLCVKMYIFAAGVGPIWVRILLNKEEEEVLRSGNRCNGNPNKLGKANNMSEGDKGRAAKTGG